VHGRGAARADDAPGTLTQSHISPSILVYEDDRLRVDTYPESYITIYTSIRRLTCCNVGDPRGLSSEEFQVDRSKSRAFYKRQRQATNVNCASKCRPVHLFASRAGGFHAGHTGVLPKVPAGRIRIRGGPASPSGHEPPPGDPAWNWVDWAHSTCCDGDPRRLSSGEFPRVVYGSAPAAFEVARWEDSCAG